MSVSYDLFTGAFLSKITEFEFINLPHDDRTSIVDEYMRRAISAFRRNCLYDLVSTRDDELREFDVEIQKDDLYEIIDIVSDGMVVQWIETYLNRQELYENAISTRDYSLYSPAELLRRVGDAYHRARRNYKQKIYDYSFNHGDLKELHI